MPPSTIDQGIEPRAVERRRLPGRTRPRDEVLSEYREHIDRVRSRIDELYGAYSPIGELLRHVHARDPEETYRWRVQLDCGCVHEVLTDGDGRLPVDVRWLDWSRDPLPAGQYICWHEGEEEVTPHREIVEWGRRQDDLPADGEEPPDYLNDLSAKEWAKMRRDQPRARWSVTLSCGHVGAATVKDLEWKPADGPVRREVGAEELAEELARIEDAAEVVGSEVAEYAKRWWGDGCPEPGTETMCFTCPRARRIVAYQRVGWLAPPLVQHSSPKKSTSRASVQRRLREAERQAAELREQLAQLDAANENDQ